MLEIRSSAVNISPMLSGLLSAHGDFVSKTQRVIEMLDESANRLEKQMQTMRETMAEVELAINTVDNDTLRELLYYRYINGYKFEIIAIKMNYNFRHVIRLHGYALSAMMNFEDLYTVAQVADLYKVKAKTVLSWIHKGKMKAINHDGKFYVSKTMMNNFDESRK